MIGAPFVGEKHASGDLKIRSNLYRLGLLLDRHAKEHEGRYPTSWEGLVQGYGQKEGHYDELIQFTDPTTKSQKRFILLVPRDGIVADDGILAQSPEYAQNGNSVVLVLKKGGRVDSCCEFAEASATGRWI